VDAFDSSYNSASLAGSFADASIPAGFGPFGIQNVNGQLYVTYAKQDAAKHDDAKGPGNGYVNVFDTSGRLVKRFASQGVLNSPWGIALAPKGFGAFAGALLVGNFGDGRINAFELATGTWLGTVNDTNGSPFSIDGLWGIAFGNGANGGDLHSLYFTAGLNGEADGLFASLTPVQPSFIGIADGGSIATLNWAGGLGPFLLQKKGDLSDSNWVDVLTTGNRTMPIAKDTAAGVVRVAPQTTKTVLPFTVLLNGASEVPEINTPATAMGTLSLDGSNLTYHISFSGLSAPATGAHIHAPATATNTANVVVPFSPPPATEGTISGTAALTPDLVADIINANAYVNIHTTNNPAGEIRGQIVPLHFPVTINGSSEVPAVQTTGSGSATLTLFGSELFSEVPPTASAGFGNASLSLGNGVLNYNVSFSNLLSAATGSHIHGPASTTQNANVIIPFSPPAASSGAFSGSTLIDSQMLLELISGLTYVNVHTTNYPAGEIRGQVLPQN
jgi:hypothetical protein